MNVKNIKLIKVSGFHQKIKLNYEKTVGGILFEDGVVYTDDEIKNLKNKNFDYESIHKVKKNFEGIIFA